MLASHCFSVVSSLESLNGFFIELKRRNPKLNFEFQISNFKFFLKNYLLFAIHPPFTPP